MSDLEQRAEAIRRRAWLLPAAAVLAREARADLVAAIHEPESEFAWEPR